MAKLPKPIYTHTPKPVALPAKPNKPWTPKATTTPPMPVLPSGTPTPASGIYEEVGPRGGRTNHQATSTHGNPLPPTHKPDHGWRLFEAAQHSSDDIKKKALLEALSRAQAVSLPDVV